MSACAVGPPAGFAPGTGRPVGRGGLGPPPGRPAAGPARGPAARLAGPVAALDVGTNTVRLLVADLTPGGLHPRRYALRITRLGGGAGPEGLAPAAIERTVAAVAEFARIMREEGVAACRAVATSAAREAPNRSELVARVRDAAGIELDIVSGDQEAALAMAGVRWALARLPHALPGRFVLLDVGGGSTEVVVAERHDDGWRDETRSLPLGAVRLVEQYLHGDPPTPAELARLEAAIEAGLAAGLPPGLPPLAAGPPAAAGPSAEARPASAPGSGRRPAHSAEAAAAPAPRPPAAPPGRSDRAPGERARRAGEETARSARDEPLSSGPGGAQPSEPATRDFLPMVGTAGTITTLAAMDLGLTAYDRARITGHRLSRAALETRYAQLAAMPAAARLALPGLERGREDLIVAGLAIVLAVMRRLGAASLTAVDAGLLEGICLGWVADERSAP